jgi:hypothetical protein
MTSYNYTENLLVTVFKLILNISHVADLLIVHKTLFFCTLKKGDDSGQKIFTNVIASHKYT